MRQWYYVQSGERRGPVPEPEFREMFEMARLSASAPVWTEGLEGWRPAHDIKGLVPSAHTPPPLTLPKASSSIRTQGGDGTPSVPQERPWVRFWARLIDQQLVCLLISIILALLFPAVFQIHYLLLSILLLFAYVFIEPAMFAAWGTTPGKALLRVSVRNRDGGRLSYSEAFNRMIGVYVRGEGLGIPLVNLLTMDRARQRLKNEGITSWDEDRDIAVSHDRVGVWRASLAVLLCVLIMLSNLVSSELLMLRDVAYLNNLAQTSPDEGAGQTTAPYLPATPSQSVMPAPILPQGTLDRYSQPAPQPPTTSAYSQNSQTLRDYQEQQPQERPQQSQQQQTWDEQQQRIGKELHDRSLESIKINIIDNDGDIHLYSMDSFQWQYEGDMYYVQTGGTYNGRKLDVGFLFQLTGVMFKLVRIDGQPTFKVL